MRVLFFLWLQLISLSAMGAIVVVDDTGKEIALAQPAQRIISLAPHATELLFAAGAGDKVVGVVDYSDYPEVAKRIVHVGSYEAVDIEAILALRPDLIVGWTSGNPRGMLERLEALGLRVFRTEPRDLRDISANLRSLGRLAGSEAVAEAAAQTFTDRVRTLQQRYQNRPPVSLFYQIWDRPLMTINGQHIISKVIELCGGRNIFAELSELAPQVGLESVLVRNPQAIIMSGMGYNNPQWIADWQRWKQLAAVKGQHLYTIPPDVIQRHTPRLLIGAELMCAHLEKMRKAQE